MKSSCCRVYNERSMENFTPFELPDGTFLNLDHDAIYSPDLMFKNIGDHYSISNMVMNCITACDVDIRKELFGNIIVVGGNTLFPNFVEKLTKGISPPSACKLKVISSSDSSERRFSSWLGGSILGSLGSMHSLWIPKAEYEEVGAIAVENKCP